jgi:hypothetical protein
MAASVSSAMRFLSTGLAREISASAISPPRERIGGNLSGNIPEAMRPLRCWARDQGSASPFIA